MRASPLLMPSNSLLLMIHDSKSKWRKNHREEYTYLWRNDPKFSTIFFLFSRSNIYIFFVYLSLDKKYSTIMNKHLLLLLLFACSWASKANMAKPYTDGTSHTCLILTNDCSVTHEKIIAEIIKDDKNSFNNYIIRFRAKYHISSAKEQSIPLLFMASNYLNDQQVFVNGQAISSNSIGQEQDYPFLRKEEIIDTLQYSDGTPTRYNTYTKYYISYDGKEEEEVTPSDLIYFTAPLKTGENVIEVSYSAVLAPGAGRSRSVPRVSMWRILAPG